MKDGEGRFVGRQELLAKAREAIDSTDPPPLLCIYGSTEIGKSRLRFERIAEQAAERGCLAAFVDLEEHPACHLSMKSVEEPFRKPLTGAASCQG